MSGVDIDLEEINDDVECLKTIVHPDLIQFLLRDKKLANLEASAKGKKDKKSAIVSAHVRDIKALTTIPVANVEIAPTCTKVFLSGGKQGEKDFSRITLVKGLLAHKMIVPDEKNPGGQIIAYIAVDGAANIAYIFQRIVKKAAGQIKEVDEAL